MLCMYISHLHGYVHTYVRGIIEIVNLVMVVISEAKKKQNYIHDH